jgi:hypothetical protein
MYPQYNCLNVPTWIIGPALGEGLLIDRPADVLKVWPTREPIQRLPPAQFSPLLDQLAEEETRNGMHAKRQSSSETTLGLFLRAAARVAVSFLGVSAKNIPLEPPRKRKREVFTLRLPYSCTQRPKTRDLSPAATSTASCSGPLEPDTGIFPWGPISGIQASPPSVLVSICAGSKACNKGPERSCIEFIRPEKTRRRSDLRRRSYRFSAKGGNCL